jgi:hypothetical protein
MTFERQAFDAHMRINNTLTHVSLENVKTEVYFMDENREPIFSTYDAQETDALFFIRLFNQQDSPYLDGTGTVTPATSTDINWLIIPGKNASNGLKNGALYYVGAILTYTMGGEENRIEVNPDFIYVRPMPQLVLDYFLPYDVFGDNLMTKSIIEESIPFSLALRVINVGSGLASNVKIDSAQPKITDNENDLPVNFKIESCLVDGIESEKSLLATIGDLYPQTSRVAQWIMTSSLTGDFSTFSADFSHSDELGGELTSLIDAVHSHRLIRPVLVDLPGRDQITDLLACDSDSTNAEYRTYTIFESSGLDTNVYYQSKLSKLMGNGLTYELQTQKTDGFAYIRLPDPFGGQKDIKSVVRSDGKVMNEVNVWIDQSYNESTQHEGYFFNLFDVNTTNSYDIMYSNPETGPKAPVLQYITDKVCIEGNTIQFITKSSDPNGTIPKLSTEPLPFGADFIDQNNGMGIFTWKTRKGQAGQYNISIKSSDGELSDSQKVKFTIVDESKDTDNDGISDDWEYENFNSLARNGQDDFDNDGISDYDEYQQGTDPTLANPQQEPPVANAGPDQNIQPENLVILDARNSYDPNALTMTYQWIQTHGPEVTLSDYSAITTSFISPANESSLIFKLIVSTTQTLQSEDMCIVNICKQNKPPIASAGADQQFHFNESIYTIVLNGSNSWDLDDGIAEYHWIQIDGIPIALSNPDAMTASFDISGLSQENISLNFCLTVKDAFGLKSQDTCMVNLINNNSPPMADAGEDQMIQIEYTSPVILDSSSSYDVNDDQLTYQWYQLSGPPVLLSTPSGITTVVNTSGFSYTEVSLLFGVDVMDTSGLKSTDTCMITFYQDNLPPVANAGVQQTADASETEICMLNGSESIDTDGTIISYQWIQIAGPQVTLSDPTVISPTFSIYNFAPGTAQLSFQLIVTDEKGMSHRDDCIVTVIGLSDTDQDGIPDHKDVFPNDPNEWADNDTDGIGDNADTDDDNDDMPDIWEQEYGLNPVVNDANQDADKDGITNLVEYKQGSNPKKANQKPEPPVLLAPAHEMQNVEQPVYLVLDTFNDPDANDTHGKTIWQLSTLNSFQTYVINIESETLLYRLPISVSILSDNTSYYWRTKFVDHYGLESNWSLIYKFSTLDQQLDTTPVNGIPDNQEIVDQTIDIDQNGISDMEQITQTYKCLNTVSGNAQMSIEGYTNVESILEFASMPESTITETKNRPSSIPWGMINFKAKVITPGEPAVFRIYFSNPVPSDASFYKYDFINGWQNITDQVVFEQKMNYVTITLTDGGFGDSDQTINGVIADPSTIVFSISEPQGTGGGDSGGGGCFIDILKINNMHNTKLK